MQYQKPVLIQRPELRMTPQLLQSIQLMALPLQDLKTKIEEELDKNPALEMVNDTPSESLDSRQERDESETYFENSSDPGFTTTSNYNDDGDGKRMFMEGALARPETLHEHLLWQLRMQPIDQARLTVGELLINNLDENGFHIEDPQLLVDESRHALIDDMIDLVRHFDPVGTCTRDFRESLEVQARLLGTAPPGTIEIIRDHLDKIEKSRFRDVARAVGISEEDVHECLAVIRRLNPFPGSVYASDEPRYVIPDLFLTRREGQFVLVLNDEEIPVLGVNELFDEVAHGSDTEARRFASQGIKDARWFIRSIDQRNQTLLKVGRAIIEFQRDFFLKGPKYLAPLTLKDIAVEVGLSEATISRITTSKYLQTDQGVIELKYFFSNSIAGTGSSGSRFSKEGVKEVIREILEAEPDGAPHLSDQKIADLLAQRGISLARRTVAKYRKELKIRSSYQR